jgi:hypothetical protein
VIVVLSLRSYFQSHVSEPRLTNANEVEEAISSDMNGKSLGPNSIYRWEFTTKLMVTSQPVTSTLQDITSLIVTASNLYGKLDLTLKLLTSISSHFILQVGKELNHWLFTSISSHLSGAAAPGQS